MKDGGVQIPPWGWIAFGVAVVALLAIDHLAHRGERAGSRRVALVWSVVWIAAGLLFNVFLAIVLGAQLATEYLATYLIEKAMSTDNMFLFYLIFDSLNIPKQNQHKVLFWGIIGAVAFRGYSYFFAARPSPAGSGSPIFSPSLFSTRLTARFASNPARTKRAE